MRPFLAVALLLAAACSSNPSKPADAHPADGPPDAADARPVDAPPADAPSGFKLHLTNALSWCDVTVDGVKYTASAPLDHYYDPGTVVNLFAAPTPNTTGGSNFIWGYWTGTDGALDGGTHDTSQTATVTMSANHDVYVCCPFPDGSGC